MFTKVKSCLGDMTFIHSKWAVISAHYTEVSERVNFILNLEVTRQSIPTFLANLTLSSSAPLGYPTCWMMTKSQKTETRDGKAVFLASAHLLDSVREANVL